MEEEILELVNTDGNLVIEIGPVIRQTLSTLEGIFERSFDFSSENVLKYLHSPWQTMVQLQYCLNLCKGCAIGINKS